MMHKISDDMPLDVSRAALVLGVSVNTLNHWRSQGRPPPFIKMRRSRGATIRYRMGDLRQMLRDSTYQDTAHALEAAASLIRVDFHEFLPDETDEGSEAQVDTDADNPEEDGTDDEPSAPPPQPPVTPPVVHNEEKPRRDDMLDVVAPFWMCRPYVLDTALSKRADFLEHFQSERVNVEWWTWRKALGMLWLEEPVWERRIEAARVHRAGYDLGEVITEHEVRVARDGSSLSYEQLLRYLGLQLREGVKPDNKDATSYIP